MAQFDIYMEWSTPYYTAPMSHSLSRRLGMQEFTVKGGCPHFGTPACIDCQLAWLIPTLACYPPEGCPTCQVRQSCPCGNAQIRAQLSRYLPARAALAS